MKHVVIALATVASLMSCQKDALVEPTTPQMNSDAQAQTTSVNANDRTRLTPQLVKHGGTTLSYDGKGRLVKMSYLDGYVERTYAYTDNVQTVTAKQGGKTFATVKYFMNAKGRCEKISLDRTLYNGTDGSIMSQNTYQYMCLYNAGGQLSKIERENVAGLTPLRYEFLYNADSDLTEIKLFQNSKLTQRYLYSYNQPYAGEPVLDKDPLSPMLPVALFPQNIETHLMDQYLDVFGPFRKHLIRSQKEELNGSVVSNYYFKYLLDANGYLTAQDNYNGVTNAYKSTVAFEYKTPLVFNPNF